MAKRELAVIVLAAGQGTRMKSAQPKALHRIGGRPMLGHVLDTARELGAARIVVVTAPGAEAVAALAKAEGADVAVQERQLGTGDAVRAVEAALKDFSGDILVLFGDVPLLTPATLTRLVAGLKNASLCTLAFRAADPGGYGRLVVENGELKRIVEEKDATSEERHINLCFAGMLAAPAQNLFTWLGKIDNKNAQGEFYLPDVIGVAHSEGKSCAFVEGAEEDMLGVNSRAQLATAERVFQARKRNAMMEAGVGFAAPDTVYLSADTRIEADVQIEPFVVFGPKSVVRSGARIRAFSYIEGAEVGAGAIVGPYARLRPGTVLDERVHVGNFVEVKNAHLEAGVKANHLSYLGDTDIGAGTNVGAGTITCNYDGEDKHRTRIGKNVFVGSHTTLVAPVKLGEGVYVGAGSVVTEDVEPDALVLGRAHQTVKAGWAAALRARHAARKKKKGG